MAHTGVLYPTCVNVTKEYMQSILQVSKGWPTRKCAVAAHNARNALCYHNNWNCDPKVFVNMHIVFPQHPLVTVILHSMSQLHITWCNEHECPHIMEFLMNALTVDRMPWTHNTVCVCGRGIL